MKFDKGPFIGRRALIHARETGIRRRLAGFEMTDPGIARHDYGAFDDHGRRIGTVTSGTRAPFLKKSIGLALFEMNPPPAEFQVDIRGKFRRARTCPTPFYQRPK